MSQITADFSGAFRKTQILGRVPKATKFQATAWTTETIQALKRSAAGTQKSGPGRKTSQMGRNVGQLISTGDAKWNILIGTGVGGKQSVKYARIQDQGGTTKAHMIYAKPGGVLAFKRSFAVQGESWSSLAFLRHVHHPGSKIPASLWFTSIIEKRKPELAAMMQPAAVLRVAEIVSTK